MNIRHRVATLGESGGCTLRLSNWELQGDQLSSETCGCGGSEDRLKFEVVALAKRYSTLCTLHSKLYILHSTHYSNLLYSTLFYSN